MKKLVLLSIAATLTFIVNAQSSFQVTELVGGAAANSNYVFYTDTSNHSSPTEWLEFKIKNVSASSKLIKIRKNILLNGTNHDIYFCYNQTCFTPFTYYWFANIAAGGVLPNGSGTSYGLRTEFDANTTVGNSLVRYTVYDSTNVSDSFNITIAYNVADINSIRKITSNASVSNAAPNPASNVINFNYDLGNTEATVKIYNALGTLVKTTQLNAATKTTQIDVSSLEEGFYIYSVIANGKAISTKRLVIAR